jgi:hypothetical protein
MTVIASSLPPPSYGAVVPNAGPPAAATGSSLPQGSLPGAVAARRQG